MSKLQAHRTLQQLLRDTWTVSSWQRLLTGMMWYAYPETVVTVCVVLQTPT